MRQTLSKIVKVLDGQPTGRRGQSMVEMALTAPLLVLMILGLVEIGFFANNYLILLDAVRSGGRVAVNLDPTVWAYGDARNQERMDCDTKDNLWLMIPNNNQLLGPSAPGWQPGQRANPNVYGYPTVPRGQHLMGFARNPYADGTDATLAFFDATACQVISSMSPLILNDSPIAASKDDVVVSAISYVTMDYTTRTGTHTANYNTVIGTPYQGYYVTVTGRWPLENRYCFSSGKGDTRDPFDFMRGDFDTAWKNGKAGQTTSSGTTTDISGDNNTANKTYEGPTQIPGNVNGAGGSIDWRILDASTPGDSQNVRGYVFTGNHKTFDNSGCYGSEFTVQDIENRLNIDYTSNNLNKSAPNSGLVIVEVFWQHHPLFFGPLFQGFTNGNKLNDPILHVWSFYPIPAVESTPTPAN